MCMIRIVQKILNQFKKRKLFWNWLVDARANLQQSLLKEPVLQVYILTFLQN